MRKLVITALHKVLAGEVIKISDHKDFKTQLTKGNDFGIKKLNIYFTLLVDGDAYDIPEKVQNSLANDYKMLWAKDFFEKWSDTIFDEPFEKVFKDDEFSGQDDRSNYEGNYDLDMVYALTFKDNSILELVFSDLEASEPDYDIRESGPMAEEFSKASQAGKIQWNTDTLEDLAKAV